MTRETRRRRWRRAVRRLGGAVKSTGARGPRDLAGALLAMPDAQLAAAVRALPEEGAAALAEMVWAMRPMRERGKRR